MWSVEKWHSFWKLNVFPGFVLLLESKVLNPKTSGNTCFYKINNSWQSFLAQFFSILSVILRKEKFKVIGLNLE